MQCWSIIDFARAGRACPRYLAIRMDLYRAISKLIGSCILPLAAVGLSFSAEAVAQTTQKFSAMPGKPLPIKLLKHTNFFADDRVWKIRAERVNAGGVTEFTMGHLLTRDDLSVIFHENFQDAEGVSGQEALDELIGAMKKAMPRSRDMPVPAGLVSTEAGKCRALSIPSMAKGRVNATRIVCISMQEDWRLVTAILATDTLIVERKGDISRLFSSLRIAR